MSGVYHYVLLQDFTKPWTDEELYKKYNLTDEEILLRLTSARTYRGYEIGPYYGSGGKIGSQAIMGSNSYTSVAVY